MITLNQKYPPDKEHDNDDIPKFSWQDRWAFIFALYKIVLPQVFLMAGVVILLVWLLFTFWIK